MENNGGNSAKSGGIGLAGVLGIVFIILKLCGVIAWPWIWVVSPFWIPVAIWLSIVVISSAIIAIAAIAGKPKFKSYDRGRTTVERSKVKRIKLVDEACRTFEKSTSQTTRTSTPASQSIYRNPREYGFIDEDTEEVKKPYTRTRHR